MPRQTCKWPYDQLRIGDWVCCGGNGLFPAITRIVTGGGWKGLKNRDISTHTGLVMGLGNQLLIGEMTAPRIVISSLEVQYRKRGRRVICFRRPIVKDYQVYREYVQNAIGELYRRGQEYDFKGLLEFVSNRVQDAKNKMYCSEMVYTIAKDHVVKPFDESLDKKVSPEDLHICAQAETIWVAPK